MAVRPIDGNVLIEWFRPYLHTGEPIPADVVIENIRSMPTLTPPNVWVSVETPPTTEGWYHVAVLDLKTGKYTVEQDLYSIELAKAHGFEPGFCKANRWEERERIDYWCRFPAPPDRRPPEGEANA